MTTYTRDDIIDAVGRFWAAYNYGPTIRRLAASMGQSAGNHVTLYHVVEKMVADGDLIWPLANGKRVANTLRVAEENDDGN